jgi:hypothetical protein
MSDYNDFKPLYDFSLIEIAVQKFFVELAGGPFVQPAGDDDPARENWTPPGGAIPFYTPAQNLVHQKCRPRVGLMQNDFSELPDARRVDVNNVLRAFAWRGTLRFGVVTEPNYALHRDLRAVMLALIPQLQPTYEADGSGLAAGGVNQYLEFHEVAALSLASLNTDIMAGQGYYLSTIPVNYTFGIRPTKWPA